MQRPLHDNCDGSRGSNDRRWLGGWFAPCRSQKLAVIAEKAMENSKADERPTSALALSVWRRRSGCDAPRTGKTAQERESRYQ